MVAETEPPSPGEDSAKLRQHFPILIDTPAAVLAPSEGTASTSKPLNIGIVLSGGQAPGGQPPFPAFKRLFETCRAVPAVHPCCRIAGGHNVIAGLFDHLTSKHPGSRLLGFLNGPRGIINADYKKITAEEMASTSPSNLSVALMLKVGCNSTLG